MLPPLSFRVTQLALIALTIGCTSPSEPSSDASVRDAAAPDTHALVDAPTLNETDAAIVDAGPTEGELVLTDANFGEGPSVQLYAKWTEGTPGEPVALTDFEIGEASAANLWSGGIPPTYASMAGTTGLASRAGGMTSETNGLRGFSFLIGEVTEYLISFDTGVPDGRHFSGATSPRTLPMVSSIKMAWFSDGPLDDRELADVVTPTYSGTFLIVGNQSAAPIWLSNQFDWNDWQTFTTYQSAGASPLVDNGHSEVVFTRSGGTAINVVTDRPMFANARNGRYTHLAFPAWQGNGNQDLTQHLFRYFYLATGPNSLARIELINTPTYAAATRRVILPPTMWTNTEVRARFDPMQRSGMTHVVVTRADGTQRIEAL